MIFLLQDGLYILQICWAHARVGLSTCARAVSFCGVFCSDMHNERTRFPDYETARAVNNVCVYLCNYDILIYLFISHAIGWH